MSRYPMSGDANGRGRASVGFLHSRKGAQPPNQLAPDRGGDKEGEMLRSRTMCNIAKGRTLAYGADMVEVVFRMYKAGEGRQETRPAPDDLKDVRARLFRHVDRSWKPVYEHVMEGVSPTTPRQSMALGRCSEATLIILLCCAEMGYRFNVKGKPWSFLRGPPKRVTMASLSGVAMGLCAAHDRGRRLRRTLEEASDIYHRSLEGLGRNDIWRLRDFAMDLCDLLNKMPSLPSAEA